MSCNLKFIFLKARFSHKDYPMVQSIINMSLATLYLPLLDKCFQEYYFIPIYIWFIFNEPLYSSQYSFTSVLFLNLRGDTPGAKEIQLKILSSYSLSGTVRSK